MATRIESLELNLTPEEEAAAERIFESVKDKAEEQLKQMARHMAAKKPQELLGRGEFELRDMVHQLGASVLEAAVNEQAQKKGRV
jgi:hypothetical protein